MSNDELTNPLSRRQTDLLFMLVEAEKQQSSSKREPFSVMRVSGEIWIRYASYDYPSIYEIDLMELFDQGLTKYISRGEISLFALTNKAYRCYEHLKTQNLKPIQVVESMIKSYFESDLFQKNYPIAFQKWSEAERLLWSEDSTTNYTTIGHLCREMMQEYVGALVVNTPIAQSEPDKSKTGARMKALLNLKAATLGKTEKAFFEALICYWGSIMDLIQRQEHGALRDGQDLVWNDARRIVFQSMNIVFEFECLTKLH